jgi:hypothetical protein
MDTAASVPNEVERYLVELMTNAGQIGGSIGGGSAGARGGGRGAAWAAKRMSTVVVDRSTTTPLPDDVVERCRAAFDRTIDLDATDVTARFSVPLGRSGLQQVVVDLVVDTARGGDAQVSVRTYAKEGWLSRHPARRVADEAIAGIGSRPD